MTLKIEPSVVPLQVVGGSQSTPAAASETPSAPASSQDRVTLTSEAIDLQALSAGSGDSFDSARVAELRNAIAEGRYEINAERIANGLMRTEQDLGAR